MFTKMDPVIVLFNIIDLFHFLLRLCFRMSVNILNSYKSPTCYCVTCRIVLLYMCVCLYVCECMWFLLIIFIIREVPYSERSSFDYIVILSALKFVFVRVSIKLCYCKASLLQRSTLAK